MAITFFSVFRRIYYIMWLISFSYIIYFVIMYTSHIIMIFNPIYILKFTFKRTVTSFKFSFCVIKAHIVNMIESVLIKIRSKIFMCFLLIP